MDLCSILAIAQHFNLRILVGWGDTRVFASADNISPSLSNLNLITTAGDHGFGAAAALAPHAQTTITVPEQQSCESAHICLHCIYAIDGRTHSLTDRLAHMSNLRRVQIGARMVDVVASVPNEH